MDSRFVEEPSSDTMIVRSLFGHSVGNIIEAHSCTYRRQSGKMYISTNSLCYYSNMFGFERKIMIRFCDIKLAKFVRTTSIKIGSQCADPGDVGGDGYGGDRGNCDENRSRDTMEEHTFRSFHNRQIVLCVILDAYKKNTGKDFRNQSHVHNLGLGADISMRLKDDGTDNDIPGLDPNLIGISNNELETFDDNEGSKLLRRPRRRVNTNESTSSYSIGHSSSGGRNPTNAAIPLNIGEGTNLPKRNKDIQREWNTIREKFEFSYDEVAVKSQIVPIPLTEFYDQFLADHALNSMAIFQESIIGDEDVQVSKWDPKPSTSEIEGDHYVECKRKMTSLHKRKARIGPSSVIVERQQVFRKFASFGIIINTVLKAEGTPFNFEMEDEWIIQAEGNKVRIMVRFRIHFLEKPPISIVRKTIMNQTRKELDHWFKAYFEMVHSALRGDNKLLTEVAKEREILAVVSTSSLFDRHKLTICCILVVLMSIAVMHIIFLMRRVVVLESEVHRLVLSNEAVMTYLDKIITEDIM